MARSAGGRKAIQDLQRFFTKLTLDTNKSVAQDAIRPIALFAIGLIVRRTQLGYGVSEPLGTKSRFTPLAASTIAKRKRTQAEGGLSGFTSVRRSNLTETGQMLDSMRILSIKPGEVLIGPRGRRDDGKANEDIAGFHARGGSRLPRRIFNNLSLLEYRQVLREYRLRFGDLLAKRKLLR